MRERLILAIAALIAVLTFVQSPAYSQETLDTADAFFENANQREADGDVEGAIIQLKNALQIQSDHAPSLLALGRTLLLSGRPAEAVLVLNDALLLGVDPTRVIPLLADAYLGSRDYSELLATLQPNDAPKNLRSEIYAARAQAYLSVGRTAEGAKMIELSQAIDADNFRAALASVTYLLQIENLEEAKKLAAKLTLDHSRDTRSWSNFGSTNHALGQLQTASESYEKAIELEPNNVDARISLIDLYLETQQDDLARPHIEFVRTTFPLEPRAAYYSALLAGRSGNEEKERAELSLATSLFEAVESRQMVSNPQMLMLASLSNYSFGLHERAATFLKNYLELRPSDIGAIRLQASNFLALDDPSMAIRVLLPAYQRNPNDSATAALLAAAYGEEGNYNRAEQIISSIAISGNDDPSLEQQLAFVQLNAGKIDEGISNLERLRESDSNLPGLGMQLSIAYLRSGRGDDALKVIGELDPEFLETATAKNLRAIAHSQLSEWGTAEKLWQEMLAADAGSLQASLNLAAQSMKLDRNDQAAVLLESAMDLHPDSAGVAEMLARVELRRGNSEDALRYAERALSLSPASDSAAWQIVRAMLALGDDDEAVEFARKFAASNASSLSAQSLLGQTFLLNDEPAQAALVYAQMSRADNLSAMELFKIARFQRQAGAPESAELSLIFALEREPGFKTARLELASVQLQLEKFDAASETAIEQIALSENDPAPRLFLAETRLRQGDIPAAKRHFRKAVALGAVARGHLGLYRSELVDNNISAAEEMILEGLAASEGEVRLQAAYSDLLLAQKRWEEADAALTRVLDLMPSSAVHFNNRAYVRQALGELEAAESDARRALELAPAYPSAFDTLGWILAAQDRPIEALPFLREADARIGDSPSVSYHLAAVLADLGRNKESLSELYHILDKNQAFPERHDAEALQERLQNP